MSAALENGIKAALGAIAGDMAALKNAAHTAPTAVEGTQDYYAYLHAPKPTNYELPIGTRHTFSFTPADIVEFASHVSGTPEYGHPAVMRLASVSGDFHIDFRAERVALDPPVTVTIEVRYPSSDGTPQFMTIYNGPPDGMADLMNPFAFDQEDYINFSNYDAALTVQGLDLDAATVRNLNLWHHAELEIWADARQDLKDVRDGVIGELLVAAGKIAAIEAELPAFAHKVTAPAHDDTLFDFLHTEAGTVRTVGAGDRVWSEFGPADVQEFFSHTAQDGKAYIVFASASGQFSLRLSRFDDGGSPGVEILLEWQTATGGAEQNIYSGPADGSGLFGYGNIDFSLPVPNVFINNPGVLTIVGMDGGYMEMRELELWKHFGSRSMETTYLDLDAVSQKLTSGIATLSGTKLGKDEAQAAYQPRITATGSGNLLAAPDYEGGPPGAVPIGSLNAFWNPLAWPIGTEVDLGSGLYGQRFAGTVTSNASAQNWATLVASGVSRIVSSGGWWKVSTESAWGDTFLPVGATYDVFRSFMRSQTNGAMTFFTLSGYARTAAPYEVWATYSKA